jgi:PAS domain S-box-containing protein
MAVEQSPVSVVITDPGRTISYVNRKFTEVTGYAADEVVGKNPRVLKSGRCAPEMYKELWSTITEGREWRREFSNRRKNGDIFWEAAKPCEADVLKKALTTCLVQHRLVTAEKELLENTLMGAIKVLTDVLSLANPAALSQRSASFAMYNTWLRN